MSFNAKSEILSAIAKTDDPAMKTVLLLLLGVFEEIGSKIDIFLNNERAIRETVLNGHEPVHHNHHEWLAHRIARDDEMEHLIGWIKAQKAEQEENRKSGRKIRDGLIEKVLATVLVSAIGFLIGRATTL